MHYTPKAPVSVERSRLPYAPKIDPRVSQYITDERNRLRERFAKELCAQSTLDEDWPHFLPLADMLVERYMLATDHSCLAFWGSPSEPPSAFEFPSKGRIK